MLFRSENCGGEKRLSAIQKIVKKDSYPLFIFALQCCSPILLNLFLNSHLFKLFLSIKNTQNSICLLQWFLSAILLVLYLILPCLLVLFLYQCQDSKSMRTRRCWPFLCCSLLWAAVSAGSGHDLACLSVTWNNRFRTHCQSCSQAVSALVRFILASYSSVLSKMLSVYIYIHLKRCFLLI